MWFFIILLALIMPDHPEYIFGIVVAAMFFDYMVFKSGADGIFWTYKTTEELKLQQAIIAAKQKAALQNKGE